MNCTIKFKKICFVFQQYYSQRDSVLMASIAAHTLAIISFIIVSVGFPKVYGEQKPKEQKLMQRVHFDLKSCGPKFKTAGLKVPLSMSKHQGSGSEELSHTEENLTTHISAI